MGRGLAAAGEIAATGTARSGRGIAAPARRELRVPPETDSRLDVFLARALDVSRTQAATLIAAGAVDVEGRREKASYRPLAGELVTVVQPEPAQREIIPEAIALTVVFEDEHLLVVDKPAGMVVHPAPGNWSGTLVNALLGRSGRAAAGEEERAGLVHRLDKQTSGLLLVAKTERAHRRLSTALAARRISRRYAVMAWGHLSADHVTVDSPLARSPRDRKRMAVVPSGRPARTEFVRLARFRVGDFLRAHLHTGRTHQIRVHLASVGHPVIGDDTYGGGGARRLAALPPKRHFLHAAWLRFRHPESGETIDLRSPLPPDLRTALLALADWPELGGSADALATLGFYEER